MRRAADLYPGEATTDRRDAYVLADTARTRRRQVHWLGTNSDELLTQLRVLSGFDIDLAADPTRLTNRLRDAVTSFSPALERAIGSRLAHAGVRDLLIKFPTPTALRAAGRARIAKTIKVRSPRLAIKVTDAVVAALDARSLSLPAEEAIGRVVAEVASELDRLHSRRDRLAAEIEEVFLAHPFGEILISRRRTTRWRSDPCRDRRRHAFRQRFQAGQLRRVRPGHPSVRNLAEQRVEESPRQPSPQERHVRRRVSVAALLRVETFYDRKRAEGKKHNAALICLARRRCDVILAMLRNHEHYRPPVVDADLEIAA